MLTGAMIVAVAAFISCSKDEPADPTQQKIHELTALSEKQAAALRAAVEPATKGFAVQYWNVFQNINIPRGINLLDSAKVHIKVINSFHNTYGNPLPEPPADNAAVDDLYTKAGAYIATMTELSIIARPPIEPGATGACTWALTGAVGNYTLTISGSGAMADYTDESQAPWIQYRDEIKTLVVQDGVTTIGDYAFRGCTGLSGVTISNSVTTIGNSAFESCSKLTGVTIPNSVTAIGNRAFCYCSDLNSVTIGSSVTTIGDYAFRGCTGLSGVTISNSVTSIGNYAFSSCKSLTGVSIPNSVTTIGQNAFYNCDGLASINVDASNPAYSSVDGVLFNKSQATLVCCPGGKTGSYTILNSVTTIGNDAFCYCQRLTSVIIPNSVTTIGENGFGDCSGLTSVIIPNSVTTIGSSAFRYCSGLTSVTSLNTTPPSLGNNVFYYVNTSACTLRVPASAVAAYQAAAGWNAFGTIEGI
jgi:hypothetical protein